MAAMFALLATPVTATVTQSFGSFKAGEQVVFNRITSSALMVGAAGRQEFVPRTFIDKASQDEILRQVIEIETTKFVMPRRSFLRY